MHLRISGYSPPPTPSESDTDYDPDALIWKLPVIHVEGEARGADMDEEVMRRIEGTVRMIGDNAVRWTLVRLAVPLIASGN